MGVVDGSSAWCRGRGRGFSILDPGRRSLRDASALLPGGQSETAARQHPSDLRQQQSAVRQSVGLLRPARLAKHGSGAGCTYLHNTSAVEQVQYLY